MLRQLRLMFFVQAAPPGQWILREIKKLLYNTIKQTSKVQLLRAVCQYQPNLAIAGTEFLPYNVAASSPNSPAWVAERVDARDLKSLGV
jgi:hypothetical protein